MKYSQLIILRISAVALLAGCAAEQGRVSEAEEFYTSKTFTAPLRQELKVNTGDALFVESRYIQGEHIVIPESLDMMIPGSMMIPFPVHIDDGRLELSRLESGWKYYCAEEGRAAATFPGLGSVIRQGDCVGIRISFDGTKKQWVVDNSNYNKMRTIWDKSLSEGESVNYVPTISSKPFKIQSRRRIVFDGYYGNQLHFTWEESTQTFRESKEFTFDFVGVPTVVGIKGNQFNVIAADNIKLRYEWIEFR